MNRRPALARFALWVMIAALLVSVRSLEAVRPDDRAACSHYDPPPRGCTVFTISRGERVFFGGNDDWHTFDSSVYWVEPGGPKGYGAIYFGQPDNVQQGFNERGLAYDSNGLPRTPILSHPGRTPVYGGYARYPILILRACATVEEVIAWVQTHQWHAAMHDQLHFADATGDAVVISAGPDGKVAYTRKPAGESHLVSTNFNLADRTNGSWPCWRYNRAQKLLGEIAGADELTAERAAAVLDAAHVASPSGFTVSSKVADLPNGLVYVYLFHQFDAPLVLNVADELARGAESGGATDPVSLLHIFPPETVRRVERAYQWLMARPARCDAASWAWLGLVVLSLGALILAIRPRGRALAFWGAAVAVLGPAGLLARTVAARRLHKRPTSRALLEAIGDVLPAVVGLVVALLVTLRVPDIRDNALHQLATLYGLPFVLAFLFAQGPFLASRPNGGRAGYFHTLWHRLPATLISVHLALAGILAVEVPLIKLQMDRCGVSAWVILAWWFIAVLGGCAGVLLLYGYHTWAVRRGYVAWSALLERGDGVVSPPWRTAWPWVLGSVAALAAGILLGVTVAMQLAG